MLPDDEAVLYEESELPNTPDMPLGGSSTSQLSVDDFVKRLEQSREQKKESPPGKLQKI